MSEDASREYEAGSIPGEDSIVLSRRMLAEALGDLSAEEVREALRLVLKADSDGTVLRRDLPAPSDGKRRRALRAMSECGFLQAIEGGLSVAAFLKGGERIPKADRGTPKTKKDSRPVLFTSSAGARSGSARAQALLARHAPLAPAEEQAFLDELQNSDPELLFCVERVRSIAADLSGEYNVKNIAKRLGDLRDNYSEVAADEICRKFELYWNEPKNLQRIPKTFAWSARLSTFFLNARKSGRSDELRSGVNQTSRGGGYVRRGSFVADGTPALGYRRSSPDIGNVHGSGYERSCASREMLVTRCSVDL